jgi:hypothetical protein
MERIRRLATGLALSLAFAGLGLLAPAPARAALLHPDDTSQFPDLSAGFVSGTLSYTAATGEFSVQNVPYALALGTSASSQYDVAADPAGQRTQALDVHLNPDGTVNQSADNTYDLYGSVTVAGKTYSGLLLSGTPTAMGSLDLAAAPTNVQAASMFDLDVKITGGLLAQAFGSEAYIRLTAERWSTFNGSFDQDFSGGKVASNIRGYNDSPNMPIPEPTTLVVLIACGGAGLLRRVRRISREELVAGG